MDLSGEGGGFWDCSYKYITGRGVMQYLTQ